MSNKKGQGGNWNLRTFGGISMRLGCRSVTGSLAGIVSIDCDALLMTLARLETL
jgi:hypothetical protein